MNTKSLFIALGLFLSVALALSGSISKMNWSTLSNPDRYNQLVLLAAYFILVTAIMIYGKRGAVFSGLTIIFFVATLLGKILPLFVAIWFIISAIAFGAILVLKF